MKTLHIGFVLALSATLTLACGDDDSGTTGAAGASSIGGAGGDGDGDNEVGGAGGAPAETCELVPYGQDGGAAGAAASDFELIGTWEEEFIGAVTITSSYWNGSGIAGYDSEANVVYTQSPCDAEYNPGRFSKIVYTEPTEDSFYYCSVVFDAKTLAEAEASDATADAEDLEAGCGTSGFPWSKVTR